MNLISAQGWVLLKHPLFEAQIAKFEQDVARKGEYCFSAKLLKSIEKVVNEVVPADPGYKDFSQGLTLGSENKHWRRAVFNQQYRLFFRYDSRVKVIIYVWVNDEDTKRAYESKSDAYQVFRKMLDAGYPPDDFEDLLKQAGFRG